MVDQKNIDKDPVTAEYDIFITPQLAEQLYVLQYPIRSSRDPYNRDHGAGPSEMRVKTNSKFIELDVNMDPNINFNKKAGMKWGDDMKKAKASGISTFGAAAGFGPGSIKVERGHIPTESRVRDFDDSLQEGRVFHKQTLGGHILDDDDGRPQYMLGTFRKNELHLTKVAGIAQMRPQFHHLDADTHVQKATTQRDQDEPRVVQPRGLTQSYKTNKDDDSQKPKSKNVIQMAQEEKWTRLKCFDEEDSESYNEYAAKLFVDDTANADSLISTMNNEEYLDAISVPRQDPSGRTKKNPLTKKQREAVDRAVYGEINTAADISIDNA